MSIDYKQKLNGFWNENKSLFLFLVLMVAFRSTFADWNTVPTGSMKPTIIEGDRILVNKMAYDIRIPLTHISLHKVSDPLRGDIIVFDSVASDKRLVKRVIGLPGDVIELNNNILKVNGQVLDYINIASDVAATDNNMIDKLDKIEKLPGAEHRIRIFKSGSRLSNFPAVRVPDRVYLAMGDNRDNSADSRVIGFIPRDEIVGRTQSLVLSFNYDNYYIPRSNRFLQKL